MHYPLLSPVAIGQMFVRAVAIVNKPANGEEGRKEGSERKEGSVANAPIENAKSITHKRLILCNTRYFPFPSPNA